MSKGKYETNPLVPIAGERVRAAVEAAGLTVREAARKLGERQQTLDSIVQGHTDRCRLQRRGALAHQLGVTESWLSGAPVPPAPIERFAGSDGAPYQLDENMRRFAEGRAYGIARYQIAWARLSRAVVDAWGRDIASGVPGAEEALGQLTKGRTQGSSPWSWVTVCIQRLLSSFGWRQAFLLPGGGRRQPPEADDAVAVGMASALEKALEPWFQGRQRLDFQWFCLVLSWAAGGMLTPSTRKRFENAGMAPDTESPAT